MKKILLSVAILALLSACGGGGNGSGTVAGIPADAVPAGQGDTFVSAVLVVTNASNSDMLTTEDSVATYDNSIGETTSDFAIPDTLA